MNGYHGRFLDVDLGAGTTKDLPLSEEHLTKYIGGATLAAALVYDRVSQDLDPLSPQNPLVFSTGPFTGSPIPMVSRYAACGVSPLTGYWGEATSGGSFPFRLKGSGFDGILFTGRGIRSCTRTPSEIDVLAFVGAAEDPFALGWGHGSGTQEGADVADGVFHQLFDIVHGRL